ncbi:hypothetical protein [Streptomyces lienomycini]|uniref:Uncharacterized protein n=1 Tax=Streptomyces lienomycini TaxID=284035 RepID=A0ABV9WXV5_9ACTN|nr:hypothetical protein [Streptomyces lienomycini]
MIPLNLAASRDNIAALPAAAFVAACALVFTVASFWWLNARRGHLKTWEPHSFALAANTTKVRIRFPLVLHNTGAKPIVVLDLRLSFPDEPSSVLPLPWTTTRDRLRPESDDGLRLPACFAVAGRGADQLFVEFGAPFPSFVPEARDYKVRIEAKLGHRLLRHRLLRRAKGGWQHLVTFPLRAAHITEPGRYLAYSNSPHDLTKDDVRKANEALAGLLNKLEEYQQGQGKDGASGA